LPRAMRAAVVLTKDRDFDELLERRGPPPHVIWVTAGNTSSARMRELLGSVLAQALDLVTRGEPLVELASASTESGSIPHGDG